MIEIVINIACIWAGVYLALSSMETYGSALKRVKRLSIKISRQWQRTEKSLYKLMKRLYLITL